MKRAGSARPFWLFAWWPAWAFLASAVMLAIAHAFQTFGHLAPCHLCLKQREVYWTALAVSAGAALAQWATGRGAGALLGGVLLTVVFAYGAYLAGFHAGAEWKWWPAPQSCASAGPVSLKDLSALLRGAPSHAPACDVAPWRLLGLSMAGWNFLISVALAILSLVSALAAANKGGQRRKT